jgi:two-component sensor histidine kinase
MVQVNEIMQLGVMAGYYDLTGNGIAELVYFLEYGDFISIEAYSFDGELLFVERMDGRWPPKRYIHCFGDYNKDGKGEIYCISRYRDSLFLNQVFLSEDQEVQSYKKYLGMTMHVDGDYDFAMQFGVVSDLDKDGVGEVFFHIHGGYSLTPRRLYIYHPEEQKLVQSAEMGIAYSIPSFIDLNGDNQMEIILGSNSVFNYSPEDEIAFGDQKAGIFIFDTDLQLIKPPLEFTDHRPYLNLFPVITTHDTLIAVVQFLMGSNSMDTLFLFDKNLVRQASIELDSREFVDVAIFGTGGERRYYLGSRKGDFQFLDVEKISCEGMSTMGKILSSNYLDPGFARDYKFLQDSEHLYVVDRSLSRCSDLLELSHRINDIDQVSADNEGGLELALHLDSSQKSIMIQLTINPIYKARYAIYVLFTLLVYSVSYFVVWILRFLYLRRKMLEYRLQMVALQSVYNQMHPHFTFNVLSAVGSLIYSGSRDEAYQYLNDVSDMLRIVLNSGSHSEWSLQDELNFIDIYIKLENVRFSGKYIYTEDIDENVNRNSIIPKMIIQTFVENAIQHGLAHKEMNCLLNLIIRMEREKLTVLLTDNGIGRERSASISRKGTGNGIRIVREYMEGYNRLHGVGFDLEINDVFSGSDEIAGTSVRIEIPVDFQKKKLF